MTSNNYLTSYQRIEVGDDLNEGDELAPDPLIHVVPKSDQTRWNHIEDLDSFFTRVYQYHQESGFMCKMIKKMCGIVQYMFLVVLTIFIFVGIDYDDVFTYRDHHKISDCFYSFSEMTAHIRNSSFIIIFLVVASLFLIIKIFYFTLDYFYFKDIQKFYNVALGIEDGNILNVTWEEVQRRMMEVQVEQRMCIHKESLTELDIYHRILRYENYFIAMVNKNVIPLKLDIPFIGEVVFLTRTLRFNINCILFYFGAIAPFKNWHLKEEYKRAENRHKLAEEIAKRFFWAGILNLVLSPFILVLQVLYTFYNYASIIKIDPGFFAKRKWSNYGQVSLRHYNELDHELQARLSRGYRGAAQYMNIFVSPLVVTLANFFIFIFGSVAAVILLLSFWNGVIYDIEYVLFIFATFTAVIYICRSFIPNENQVWCPEVLMTKILAEVHYLPDTWKDRAHTLYVRKEFSTYFQYKAVHLLEALVSPIITPYMLCFKMANKSLEIVDFLRNFTVEVQGVGDICSFAQMDLRRHGSRTWHPQISVNETSTEAEYTPPTLTDNGKTELSLVHFTLTNPHWQPPRDSAAFLHKIKKNARVDFEELAAVQECGIASSVSSVMLGGLGNVDITQRWLNSQDMNESISSRTNHKEGCNQGISNGVLGSIVHESMAAPVSTPASPRRTGRDPFSNLQGLRPQDMVAVDMSLSTLYLHDFHRRRQTTENYADHREGLEPQQGPIQSPPRFGHLLHSNIAESCYNSSDPPSVDESLNLSSHALPSISQMPFPHPNTSYTGMQFPQSSRHMWTSGNNTPPPSTDGT